jgi:hypothetical protein
MRASLPSPYASLLDHLQRVRRAVRDFRQNHTCSRSLDRRSPRVTGRSAGLRVVNEAMRKIDRDVLPELRDRADPIAFILPSAIEWVGWESLRIADTDEEYREHVLDLSHAGLDESLLVLLGMLGPHLRQQSDEIDRIVLPLLLGIAFRRFEQSLDREDMGAARRFAGIIFRRFTRRGHSAGARNPHLLLLLSSRRAWIIGRGNRLGEERIRYWRPTRRCALLSGRRRSVRVAYGVVAWYRLRRRRHVAVRILSLAAGGRCCRVRAWVSK